MQIVLASRSPRRLALLRAALVDVRVMSADVDETFLPGEHAADAALRLARAKARAVSAEDTFVLAADTIVARDRELLGKPSSPGDARAMLASLAGRAHTVSTGVCLRHRDREVHVVVTTAVRFRALSAEEIAAYVDTGEPFDKAGGYGIQGEGGALVAAIEGSYTNVVGLPLEETLALLKELGAR